MRLLMSVFSFSFSLMLFTRKVMKAHTAAASISAMPILNHVFSHSNLSISNETSRILLCTPYLLIATNCRTYCPEDKDGKLSSFSVVALHSLWRPRSLYLYIISPADLNEMPENSKRTSLLLWGN